MMDHLVGWYFHWVCIFSFIFSLLKILVCWSGLNVSVGWVPLSRLSAQALSILPRPRNNTEAEIGR